MMIGSRLKFYSTLIFFISLFLLTTCQNQSFSPENYAKYNSLIATPPMVDESEAESRNSFKEEGNSILGNRGENNNELSQLQGLQLQGLQDTQNANPFMNNSQQMPTQSQIVTNSQGQKEELVYVPTPIDEDTFKKMQTSGNFGESNSPFVNNGQLISQDKILFPNTFNSTSVDDAVSKKLINLQESDYNKYFDNINKLEYQKVYNKLKQENLALINDEMKNSDGKIDYSKIMEQNNNVDVLLNKSIAVNNNQQIQNLPMIDLPQDRLQFQKLVSSLDLENLQAMNSEKPLSKGAVSLLQKQDRNEVREEKDLNNELIETMSDAERQKMYGTTNTKLPPEPKTHKLIGGNKNALGKISVEKPKEDIDERLYKGYPRFRNTFPHEVRDIKEKEIKDKIKSEKLIAMKKDLEKTYNSNSKSLNKYPDDLELDDSKELTDINEGKGLKESNKMKKNKVSFLQKNPQGLSIVDIIKNLDSDQEVDIIKTIKEKKKEEHNRMRGELVNCKKSCDKSCERVKMLKKNESKELCTFKCYLACSNNLLNKLLN